MKILSLYIICIILLCFWVGFKYPLTKECEGVWIPQDIQWEKEAYLDGDSLELAYFTILLINQENIALISTSAVKNEEDSIFLQIATGLYLERGKITKVLGNKIYYYYKIYDDRTIRLPEYDTIDVSKIYQDSIILSNDRLISKGSIYEKNFKLCNKSRNWILGILLDF